MEGETRTSSVGPAPISRAVPGAATGLFTAASLVAAVLVFSVQPMVAKMLLPSFGGTPAVWAVSLVFFQAVLLAGYAFVHYSIRVAGVRRQALLQMPLLLVPFAALPIGVHQVSDGAPPSFRVLASLALAAGVPFFVVTTASPLLQRWYAAAGGASGRDPYFLYAASNVGSLLGLLSYPFLIEPHLTLGEQARLWTLGYALFAIVAVLCGRRVLVVTPGVAAVEAPRALAPVRRRTAVRWIAMAAVPAALMVGTTTHLSTDIAAMPLLWVVPLALYLLSFVVAFARRTLVASETISRAAVVSSLLVVVSLLPIVPLPIWAVVAVHGLNLFVAALLVHRRLATERPPAEQLTQFYLLLSVGGVIGGAFAALAAPALFSTVAEYPLALVLALLLRPGPWRPSKGAFVRRNADLLLPFALLVLVMGGAAMMPTGLGLRVFLLAAAVSAVALARRPVRFALGIGALLLVTAVPQPALHAERTFFGTLRVVVDGPRHLFSHGTTVHGVQSFARARRGEPLSYYTRQGPLGQLLASRGERPLRVGVVGLGAGAAAAYGRAGDTYTFFEIDEAVVRIASDPRLFTYLGDSDADVRVVVGDGRLELARQPERAFDVIVLDAFSSDSVPVHLLTREALGVYLRKLAPGGVIAFHISNRYLDLAPVIGGVTRSLGLTGRLQAHDVSRAAAEAGAASSIWAVVTRDRSSLGSLAGDRRWETLPPGRVWSDQSSDILGTIRWFS